MIRRPPRSTLSSSSAASDVYKRQLEGRPPGAAVTGFSLTVQPDAPRKGQLTLFGPAEISPDRLATALAKLFALLGPGRVGAPRAVDGHRPERFALVPFAPPPPPAVRKTPKTGRGLLSVRVLRPPVPLEVLLAGERPTSLRALEPASADGGGGRPALDVAGTVRVASGPWRLEEGWWQEAPAFRTYWDVELSAGGLYRIFHDEAGGEWFADGVYD